MNFSTCDQSKVELRNINVIESCDTQDKFPVFVKKVVDSNIEVSLPNIKLESEKIETNQQGLKHKKSLMQNRLRKKKTAEQAKTGQ